MKHVYIFLCSLFLAGTLQGRDVLGLRIAVSYDQTPISEALADLAQKANFEWTYNAKIIDQKSRVSYVAELATIREILWGILGPGYEYKQNGEYLILKKVKRPQDKLIGYISEKSTGKKVVNATVYDANSLQSTTTDENGYYEIPIKPQSQIIVAKLDYRDTTFLVYQTKQRFLNVTIDQDTLTYPRPNTLTFEQQLESFATGFLNLFKSKTQRSNELNVQDSLRRPFQISFLPYIGTNLKMSGNVINDYSLNILAGYSKGNRKLEIAGMANINGGDVSGVQIAGWFNAVRGNTRGLQIGGLYNTVRDTMSGIQIGGLVNRAHTDHGMQIAGLWNDARVNNNNYQIAGLFNTAGVGNVNVQIGGIANQADTIQTTQIAGIFNRARVVHGLQIGLINSATEVDGLQLGLFNFAKKGRYLSLEYSVNEVYPLNFSFKSGTSKLYTIFSVGSTTNFKENNLLWTYGMGLGHRFRFNRYLGLNLEATYNQINQGVSEFDLNQWVKLSPTLDIPLGSHVSIGIGPSFNLLIAANQALRDQVIPVGVPTVSINNRLHGWMGVSAGVRVLF